jgi:alkanesulfonate monooxygenase SsuD/methylene tetrahydromethanopterin reductase-like flavin-dependent oxidoreductase (luciferase family)
MKFGVASNWVWFGPPITRLAKVIEGLGFESLWMGEHPVIPIAAAKAVRYGVPLPENYRHMPDPLISLTAAAVATNTLKLGTNICIVPQRSPIHLAKEVATLDRISGGRIIFAYGTGWIEEEAEVFGYRFDKRLGRTLDFMRAIKVLWTEDEASYTGEYISFPPIHCVAETADGWLPSFLSPAQMKVQLAELRALCKDRGRDFDALDISLIVPAITFGVGELPPWGADAYADLKPRDAREVIAEYEDAGVKRLLVGLPDMVDEGAFKVLDEAAKGLGLS